jgi:hypothetical protein
MTQINELPNSYHLSYLFQEETDSITKWLLFNSTILQILQFYKLYNFTITNIVEAS